nr:hypothetical protein [Tanacetum cinerariifolium]
MVISIILVSSDSSEESVRTSTRRVILFRTIPTTIPNTTLSIILHPTHSDPSEDPSSDHIPPLPATSPFLSSTDDSSDIDIPDTPPSPTHDHSLPAPSSGMRRSHHLCLLVPSIHSSFAVIFARLCRDSSSACPSCKRSRSHTASAPLSLPILGALSYARADHFPSPKRIRSSESATELEVSSGDRFEPYIPRGTSLEIDVDVMRSDGIKIDPKIQAEINECIAYADALRDRGIDARVVVEAVDRDEVETGARGIVEVRFDRVTHRVTSDDMPELAQEEGSVEAIEGIQRDQGHKIVVTGQQSIDMLERIEELERDNMRLRDMMDVASQRVTRSQRALGARDAARNLEPLIGNGNRGNGNGGNRNGNDMTAYTIRFKELVLLCTRMVPNEEDKVERRLENSLRDNRWQQPVFKRQNVGGQNVARAYMAGNNEKKWYVGSLPYCNKSKMHHARSCIVRCRNCKRVGHMTKDCKVTITPNTQRAPAGNQPSIVCYECERPRHFRKD